jgi:hypothetical protein
VIIKQRICLSMVDQKIPLILEVDPMRMTLIKVKENQEVNRSPSLRRKLSITSAKSMDITRPSVRN